MFSRKQRSKSGSAVTHSRSSLADLVGDAKKSRGFSLPTDWRRSRIKGIMKYLTHDESVHSTYGSERGAEPDEPEKAQTVAPMSPGEAAVRRKIKFADILIREYDRTIGDNPSCSSGPPISISWEYDPDTKKISIDQYEDNRPPRRTHFEMILPRSVRQEMLRKEWNVTQSQIANAVRNNIKVKNQRRATVNNLGKASKFEEMLESTQRGLKRGIFFQKSTSQQAEELRKQAEDMARLRSEVFGVDDENMDEEEYGTEENPLDADDEEEGDTSSHNVREPNHQDSSRETARSGISSSGATKRVSAPKSGEKENRSPPTEAFHSSTVSNTAELQDIVKADKRPEEATPGGIAFL